MPTAPVTVAVSLADKLDTLVAFFAIKERPTGSKDPFAIRRAMLGVIECIIGNEIRTGVRELIRESFLLFATQLAERHSLLWEDADDPNKPSSLLNAEAAYADGFGDLLVLKTDPPLSSSDIGDGVRTVWNPSEIHRLGIVDFVVSSFSETLNDVTEFCFDRVRDREKRAGRRSDLISAVLPINRFDPLAELGLGNHPIRLPNTTANDDIIRILSLSASLQSLIDTGEGANLLAGYKRAANILKKEQWDAGSTSTVDILPDEAALAAAIDTAEPTATAAIEAENFTAAMTALASLRTPIDAFFEKVIVNGPDPEVRARRLNLLAKFRDAVHSVADFSKIEG